MRGHMGKVIGYIRTSRVKNPAEIARQQQAIQDWVNKHVEQLDHLFIDECGSDPLEQLQLQAAIRSVSAGSFFIIGNISRISRNMADVYAAYKYVESAGGRIINLADLDGVPGESRRTVEEAGLNQSSSIV